MAKNCFQRTKARILDDFWNGKSPAFGQKLPTERKLAELYGVSRTTIGQVIASLATEGLVTKRQGSGIFIAAETVQAAGRMIGCVLPSFRTVLANHVFEGVEYVARSRHVRLEAFSSEVSIVEEKRRIATLVQHGVEGIILYPVSRYEENIEYLDREFRSIPMVVVDLYLPRMNRTNIVFDNFTAARHMTRALFEQGHRSVAFLAYPANRRHRAMDDRIEGYRRAHQDADVPIVPERVVDFDGRDAMQPSHVAAMERILALNPRPTAILTPFDPCAQGSIAWLRSRGIRVPGEIVVSGFDNTQQEPWEERFPTTQPDFARMGERAAELLLEQIERPGSGMREIVLPCPVLMPEALAGNYGTALGR